MRAAREGFTLIELIVVMVVLAVVASIALVQYQRALDNSYMNLTRADLRLMALKQEIYHGENGTYAGAVATVPDFTPSDGVDITIGYAESDGWGATAVHTAASGVQCGYYTGEAPASSGDPATAPNTASCTADN